MALTANRAATAATLLAAALVAACGGAPVGAPPDPPPSTAFRCTGPEPAHASPCPGAETALTADAPLVLAAACGQAPCTWACQPGYTLQLGACQPPPLDPPASTQVVDNHDGTVTVTDIAGSATWLKDTACLDAAGGVDRAAGDLDWYAAMNWSAGLADGACGLTDGSAAGAWRLPTHAELLHLQVDLGSTNPFTGIQGGLYWSSWTYWRDRAEAVDFVAGTYAETDKLLRLHVWPLRD